MTYPFLALTLALTACGPDKEDPDTASETTQETGGDTGASSGTETQTTGEPTTDAPTTETPTTTSGDEPPPGAARPQESAWVTVVDALPFPLDIERITVGRPEFAGNFANRGKVEVHLDQEQAVITVEMRVYDFTGDLEFFGDGEGPGVMHRMRPWAFAGDADPKSPLSMPAEDDCTEGAWKQDCVLTAYYDAKAQAARSGADFIVHLPRAWRGAVHVFTDDNLAESSYPRLGDVRVEGLCGSGHVSLASGTAQVRLCEELGAAPTCPADQVAECDEFTDAMGEPAPWSPECPCASQFGALLVESREDAAANLVVDIPEATWISAVAVNVTGDPDPLCLADIVECLPANCTATGADPGVAAEFNLPSPAAHPGTGYAITARTAGCGPVEFFTGPEAGQSEQTPPMVEPHGRVRICTDC